ncbi:MAG: carboxypeptidase regulatory-like domain-containing protein [Bdellovibrionales bacterium]|nr:carboxypeptidase regulatory-like domain-containing protein [Bdellovibrionales bacterium]
MDVNQQDLQHGNVWEFLEKLTLACFFVFLFSVVTFKPTYLEKLEVVEFDSELTISIPVNAPPYSALSDEDILPLAEAIAILPENHTLLTGETGTAETLVSSLLYARSMEELSQQIFSSRGRAISAPVINKVEEPEKEMTITLEGMTVSVNPTDSGNIVVQNDLGKNELDQNDINQVDRGFAQRWRHFDEMRISVPPQGASSIADSRQTPEEKVVLSEEEMQQLTPELRNLITQAETANKQKWVGKIWVGLPSEKPKTPTPDQSISEKSTIAKNDKKSVDPQKESKPEPKGSGIDHGLLARGNDNPPSREPQGLLPSPDPSPSAFADEDSDRQPEWKSLPWPDRVSFQGHLTLKSGIAMLGTTGALRVFRYLGDGEIEVGEVDQINGEYKIDILNPAFGSLIVELRDSDGQLMGVYETLLADLEQRIKLSNTQMDISVQPVDELLSGNAKIIASNFESTESQVRMEIPEINRRIPTKKSGGFEIRDFMRGSNFLARFVGDGFWKTLAYLRNGASQKLNIASSGFIKQFEKEVSNVGFDVEKGLVWGRITNFGNSVPGVRVELAGEGFAGPFYVGDDGRVNRNSTGKNGIFLIGNINPGVHLVRARNDDMAFPAKIVSVEAGHISNLDLERGNKERAEIYIYDATTGEILDSALKFIGSERVANSTSGVLSLNYVKGNGPVHMEIRVHKPGYEAVRTTFDRNDKMVQVPVPSIAWMAKLSGIGRINFAPDLSNIVGFVQNDRFRVYPPESAITEQTRVVYFDSYGNPVEDADWGEYGGGFAILNAKPGFHNLVIENSKGRFALRAVINDYGSTSVLVHRF